MQEQEKKELLSKLYALRAGLSVISIEKEETVLIKQRKQEIASNEYKTYKKINSEIAQKNDRKEELENSIPQVLDNRKGYITACIFGAIVCLLVAFLFLKWRSALKNWEIPLIPSLLSFLLLILAILIGGGGVICGIGLIINKNDEVEGAYYVREKNWKEMEKVDTEIADLNSKKQQLHKGNLKKLEELDGKIVIKKENTSLLYDALKVEYSVVLDERDWREVDLIIYCFETGRADTMKEALLWADEEIRIRTLEQAINNASMNICNTINTAMSRLQSSMVQCFSLLSEQLNVMHQQQMKELEKINIGVQGLNDNISNLNYKVIELTQATNMNNALQEKANVSSLQLVQDVQYMRTLTENSEIRRRNNM